MPQQPLAPEDFAAYWNEVDEELARYSAAPEITPLPLRDTEHATTFAVRLTSLGPYRLFGYLCVPRGRGPFPAVYQTPRYGSVNHIPDYHDRERYVVLQLMHRGQRLADEPFSAAYPGLLTRGIEDPRRYVYRQIVADCLRGAEFLLSYSEVDSNRTGIVGDDLALIVAARRPGFGVVMASGLLFYRLMEARLRTDAYPIEEVNDVLRAHPERLDEIARTLAYVDPVAHAFGVRGQTLIPFGDAGAIGGPEWLQPLREALAGHVTHYTLSHEGGTDQDWLDAWLARQLGAEPRSRFLRSV